MVALYVLDAYYEKVKNVINNLQVNKVIALLQEQKVMKIFQLKIQSYSSKYGHNINY